jgi:hypothetical protein
VFLNLSVVMIPFILSCCLTQYNFHIKQLIFQYFYWYCLGYVVGA